jgi:hypothetical protein
MREDLDYTDVGDGCFWFLCCATADSFLFTPSSSSSSLPHPSAALPAFANQNDTLAWGFQVRVILQAMASHNTLASNFQFVILFLLSSTQRKD